MAYLTLVYYLDLLAFALLSLATAWYADRRVLRQLAPGWPRLQIVSLTVLLVVAGIGGALWVGNIQRARLRVGIQGVAPTYAVAMELMGHSKIRNDTPPDDPTYLSIIERQRSWLANYPAITDIYTMRLVGPNQLALIVDSETDYNHDGEFTEERESRTKIGELYPQPLEAMLAATRGESVFDDVPATDRWGTMVSAFTPMRDEQGNIEAIVGIDFAAEDWIRTLLLGRGCVLGAATTTLTLLVVIITVTNLKRAEIERERRFSAELQTQKRAVEDSLNKLESYQVVLDAHALVCITDQNGTIVHVNDKYSSLYGVGTHELLGKGHHLIHQYDEPIAVWDGVWQSVSQGQAWRGEVCSRDRHGSPLWIDTTVVPYADSNNHVAQHIVLGTDITAKKRYEEELVKAARFDRLTGLPNRSLLLARLQFAINRFQENPCHLYALMFLDFDRFKHTNDTLGHEVGDQLLQEISRRLVATVGPDTTTDLEVFQSTVARFGGDEFVVLAMPIDSREQAMALAKELLGVLAAPYHLGEHVVHSSASIGLTLGDQRYESCDQVLHDADLAMYAAKARGKCRCVVFESPAGDGVLSTLSEDAILPGESISLSV